LATFHLRILSRLTSAVVVRAVAWTCTSKGDTLPGPATGAAEEATGRADAALPLAGAPTCAATGKASVAIVRTQKYQLLFMLTRFLTKWLWLARQSDGRAAILVSFLCIMRSLFVQRAD